MGHRQTSYLTTDCTAAVPEGPVGGKSHTGVGCMVHVKGEIEGEKKVSHFSSHFMTAQENESQGK